MNGSVMNGSVINGAVMNIAGKTLPSTAKIVEVGPRDGLQNESQAIAVGTKVELINALSNAGLNHIEAGSFVSPKWVPQMAASDEVFASISRKSGAVYSALTPNLKGFEAALAAGVDEVAVFAAASESFSQKNINCSISDSIERFAPVVAAAKEANLPVRGYISCVVGCPYEGHVSPDAVAKVAHQLLDMGCFEVSLGDTIGVGTPGTTAAMLDGLLRDLDARLLALHCHDTYGQALANIATGLQYGINVFDSSIAGLGGCPYAKGASGNVATEDVVYMLQNSGVETGVDLDRLISVGNWISDQLNRPNQSRVAKAKSASSES